jgi:hypothetical protein
MRPALKKWGRRLLLVTAVGAIILFVAILIYFPGRQTPIALTLATGINVGALQVKVDALETKAVRGDSFSDEDKRFLQDLYQCFAKGGRLTIVLRQSGEMMGRYLACSGDLADSRTDALQKVYGSPDFYMGDPDFFESFVGLYFGRLDVRPVRSPDGLLVLSWRAEVPWKWPSYDSLAKGHGNPHAQSFPLPNARSLLQGSRYCLYMDDGLGQHLELLGLAKPFLVFSEWEERLTP